ncbi:hypothetical protein [Bacteroides caecigallinarum]|nr:hypothetical protein [Bacteroides caecigallinarum]MCF2551045.1 hypothetical protein [Bacteroides caecigallinarum]
MRRREVIEGREVIEVIEVIEGKEVREVIEVREGKEVIYCKHIKYS